ncbi:MAG: chemotaxis protein [Oscillospiraceae bacterium]|nr:chemotaxis protein [Oscillospiraceae bacterium]
MGNIYNNSDNAKSAEKTSILELLEFTIAGHSYGINVAKVTEIMQRCPITPMTKSHPYIEGVIKPRGKIIALINLPEYMQLGESRNPDRDMFMITNFENVNSAFHVHTVEAMHRIKWSDVERPSAVIYGSNDSIITGTTKIGDKIITVIDFEKVLFDINPDTGLQLSEIKVMENQERSAKPVVVVEDSVFLKKMLLQALEIAGYTNITSFDNGQDAWEYLEKTKNECAAGGIPIKQKVAIVITDIEMPRMDGHHLTRLVKSDEVLSIVPVIVFSSLIDENQISQGKSLGVDAHLAKPEIANLVSTIDQWIL